MEISIKLELEEVNRFADVIIAVLSQTKKEELVKDIMRDLANGLKT